MRALAATPWALAAVVALALPAGAGATATPAVTAQAQEADAAFLAYAPAPTAGPPGALCLVDTGVNANPDTTPGLIASYAIDNGAVGDADPQGHGTIEAMIAGAAGNGMVGAWPQLKIVSVRETTDPGAGQEPTYQFQDYYEGMNVCQEKAQQDNIKVVLLALNSTIGGSPDQTALFAQAVQALELQDNIAVVASAGNDGGAGGAIEEPASEPGVFAVGASTAQPGSLSETATGAPCDFSASGSATTLYAPGCGLDQADPFTDQPFCCGDGTSQAAAFVAASLTALMSYDPKLSYTTAEGLLVHNVSAGANLDLAAAFQADGLDSVVLAGNGNIPQAPVSSSAGTSAVPAGGGAASGVLASPTGATGTTGPVASPPAGGRRHAGRRRIRVRSIVYEAGLRSLVIELAGVPARDRVTVTLRYRGHTRPRTVSARGGQVAIGTVRPRSVVIRVYAGRRRIWSARRRV